jgi:hypothetical protein
MVTAEASATAGHTKRPHLDPPLIPFLLGTGPLAILEMDDSDDP